jgi:colanic acid biosynthesis glycosyl transferase WcaI
VTVLSEDLRANVIGKLPEQRAGRVHVIPNFVDVEVIRPDARMTPYRSELGIDDRPLVLYAGNVGFSQSLDLMLEAARACPDVWFVVNGDGAARADLEQRASHIPNIRFVGYQPSGRLPEVLASGDIHVVPLRAGLGDVSVPSKTYSSLAAGRPVVAAIDSGTEIPRLLAAAGAGVTVEPGDAAAFINAIRTMADDPVRREEMGHSGRAWVVDHASPRAVGGSYDALFRLIRS